MKVKCINGNCGFEEERKDAFFLEGIGIIEEIELKDHTIEIHTVKCSLCGHPVIEMKP